MCANYTPTSKTRMEKIFTDLPVELEISEDLPQEWGHEIWPGDSGVMILAKGEGACLARAARFGLVPAWAEPSLARHTYNARSETVAEKPSFRQAWRNGQFCLIPADAFFEPRYLQGRAQRWRLQARDGQALLLAGIWERRGAHDDYSFSMLTINADQHSLMSQFHKPGDEKRMPVILPDSHWLPWLHASPAQAMQFLQSWDGDRVLAEAAPLPREQIAISAATPAQASLF